jgi:glutamine amidotransferase-like uncharacterized protein
MGMVRAAAIRSAARLAVALVVWAAACDRGARPLRAATVTPILLFNRRGTSVEDVAAFETILDSQHLGYSTVSSAQLADLDEVGLRAYRLLIVPGGNFETIAQHLPAHALATVHAAVQGGLAYLGVCAGAFLAGHNRYDDRSFDLAPGTDFDFYADTKRGIRQEAVAISGPGMATHEEYWEDGPELAGRGSVVARYPDGTPAVTEGTSGRGWVILVGVHPEAPPSWRQRLAFSTPIEVGHAYAATVIDAALNRTWLPHD